MEISRRLAYGELKEHKRIYTIIIIVIALTMTSFMLENAYLNYMMQVVDDTTKLVTSDVVIVDEDSSLRDLYGTTVELKSAGEIARRIESEFPDYKTSIRITAQGTYGLGIEGESTDACTIQGITPRIDNEISNIASKIVEGRYFRSNDPVLRGHTPLYIEIEGPGNLPDFTWGSGEKLDENEEPYPIIAGAAAADLPESHRDRRVPLPRHGVPGLERAHLRAVPAAAERGGGPGLPASRPGRADLPARDRP